MAVEKKLQGLHIVLILFIILAIAMTVTTVLAYKKYEETLIAKKTSDQAAAAAKKEQDRLKKVVLDIKTIGGWDESNSVPDILKQWAADKVTFASTYGKTTMEVYPQMLQLQIDKYREVQDKLAQELDKVASLEKDLDTLKDEKEAVNEEHRKSAAELASKLSEREGDLAKVREDRTTDQDKNDKKFGDAARAHTAALTEEKDKHRGSLRSLARTSEQLEDTQKELKTVLKHVLDPTTPDGKIIEASATVGLVYVNRGRNDGLRRQTRFFVFDHDAALKSPDTLDPKGEIEITEILGPHRAKARVITDTVADPILPGDLIHSFIFRPGMPERFALAGVLDVDGDGRSDLDKLRSLIQINGAKLDAYVTADGEVDGAISHRTRFLVLGPRPRSDSEEAAREAYDELVGQADSHGISKIPLEQFLDYIGLQSDDQRYDLSHQARDREPVEEGSSSKPFRKRPERGEDGAF